ncbi:MAG: LptE family protein [Deltaproteobacteria bacterium]|nr:LptE family protein [Deltaproteobacteria bacterium]
MQYAVCSMQESEVSYQLSVINKLKLFTVHCSLFTVFCLLFIVLYGCGYHIAGKGGSMPGSVTTISIPFFKNQVQKPDVETIITTALVDEFVKSGIVKVVEEDAEAVLSGAITGYDLTPVSFNKTDVIQEYRLTIKLEISLVRKSDGKILWEDKNITDYEDFKVNTNDVNATKTAELDAMKKMAKDTARLIKERMLEDF